MFDTNPDGAGFAWEDCHNQMRIKTFMEFKPFWDAYSGTVQGYKDKPFLVHFRIGTHGSKTIDNVHPFKVDHNTVMAHNGIVNCVQDYKDGRSDTRIFVEETLPLMPDLWLDSYELRWLVEEAIGYSKMVFLTNDPRLSSNIYILNQQAGKELPNGIWVSNLSWEKKTPAGTLARRADSAYAFKTASYPVTGGWSAEDEREFPGAWVPMGNASQVWRPERDDISRAAQKVLNTSSPISGPWKFAADLEKARLDLGYDQPVAYIDGEWLCMGCWTETDPEGDCACYQSVCLTCVAYAADCQCLGMVKDIVLVDDIMDNPELYAKHLDDLCALHNDFEYALLDVQLSKYDGTHEIGGTG